MMRNRTKVLLLLCAIWMLIATVSSANGSLPNDVPFDCPNSNPGPECNDSCKCKCKAGGGGPGGEGKDDGHQRPPHKDCLIGPCNSGLLSSPFGSPDRPLYRAPGTFPSPTYPTAPGESDNGKRIVTLRRQDFFAPGNGGGALELARVYNNVTVSWAANDDGRTLFGPKWALGLEMGIGGPDGGTTDKYLRLPHGGQCVLYNKGPNYWETNPAQGEALIMSWNGSEYKVQTIDPSIWYAFNGNGKLLTSRYPNGNLVRCTYDSQDRLAAVSLDHETNDIDNRSLLFEYTTVNYQGKTRDRISRVLFAPSGTVVASYSYDAYGMLFEVRNGLGEITERYVNMPAAGDASTALLSEIYAPDATGQLRMMRKYEYTWWRFVTRTYDGAGALIMANDDTNQGNLYVGQTFFPSGVGKYYILNHARNATIDQTWLANPVRRASTYTQTFLPDTNWYAESAFIKQGYDDKGNGVTYSYVSEDSNGPLFDRCRISRITKTDGSYVSYDYDQNRRISAVRHSDGRTRSAAYDGEGNTLWLRNGETTSSTFQYDSWGRMVSVTIPDIGASRYAYDSHGNVTETTDTEGVVSSFQYDSRDRLVRKTIGGLTNLFAYDQHDRLTTLTGFTGRDVCFDYDLRGRAKSLTEAGGSTTSFIYDSTGTLARVDSPDGGSVSYTHDAAGRLTGMTNERGTTTYGYDTEGRLTTETDALSRSTVYSYVERACSTCGTGGFGKLHSITDAAGRSTYYEYDSSGHLTRVTYSGSSDYVQFGYDSAGRRVSMMDTRLPAADLGGQMFTWEYDTMDRLTTETYPNGKKVAVALDGAGRRTCLADPDGNVTLYEYADLTHPRSVTAASHSLIGDVRMQLGSDGQVLQCSHGTGSTALGTDYHYDSIGRLDAINHWAGGGSICLLNEQYAFDSSSRLVRTDCTGDSGAYSRLFTYDQTGRILSEEKTVAATSSTAWRHSYSYDKCGNRTEKATFDGVSTTSIAYCYDAAGQLIGIGSAGQFPVTHDAVGNMVYRGDLDRYQIHDRDDRMVAVAYSNPAQHVEEYTYDALGRRLMRRLADGTKLRYYYDGESIVMSEEKRSQATSWRTKQIYMSYPLLPGVCLAGRENTAWSATGLAISFTDYWLYRDRMFNVRALRDCAGGLTKYNDLDAFGNGVGDTGISKGETSKEYLQSTGLYDFGQRWYDPQLGRFLEKDRMLFGVASASPVASEFLYVPRMLSNLYGFVNNAPTALVDPNGLSLWGGILGGAASIFAKLGGPLGGAAVGCVIGAFSNFVSSDGDKASAGCGCLGGAITGALSVVLPPTALMGCVSAAVGSVASNICSCGLPNGSPDELKKDIFAAAVSCVTAGVAGRIADSGGRPDDWSKEFTAVVVGQVGGMYGDAASNGLSNSDPKCCQK